MKITSVESFKVEIPISEEQQKLRYYHKTAVTRIRTDEGITGYGWSEVGADVASGLLLARIPFRSSAWSQTESATTSSARRTRYGTSSASLSTNRSIVYGVADGIG